MAVTKTLTNIPDLITLDDTSEHTIVINAGAKSSPFYTLAITVVLGAGNVKFNTDGAADDSLRLYTTGDKLFATVDDNTHLLRIKGAASDTIGIEIV